MAEAVLTSKGQITLPKEIRDEYGLKEGDKVNFVPEKSWVIMVPLKGTILDLYGSVKHRGGPIDFAKLRKMMVKGIAQRHKK